MTLPDHYRRFYASFVKFACWMIFVALIAGILFQESTRKVTFDAVAAGTHWEAVYHLAFVHGHVFLIGVLIPLAVLGLMQVSLLLDAKTLTQNVLNWGGRLYTWGAGLTVALMLYKGYHYVLSVRMGQLDFVAIDHSFFGGQEIIRHIVYGVSHTAMSIGLIVLAIAILRSLPKLLTTKA